MTVASRTPEARRAYYQAHREEHLAYYQAHREEQLDYQRSYRQAHREERLDYMRDYSQIHREEWKTKKAVIQQRLNKIKLDRGCRSCGYSAHFVALAFHHLKDDKEIAIANAVRRGWSWERIEIELEKCEVMCHNCHAIEHWGK